LAGTGPQQARPQNHEEEACHTRPGPGHHTSTKAVANPTAKAIRYLPAGSIVGIDCGFLDQAQPHAGTGTPIPEWIAEQLDASAIGMVPVARPDDDAGVLRSLSRAARRLPEPEAYLRLGDDDTIPAPIASADLSRLQRSLRLGLDRIHLILDYRSVTNRRAAAAYATAAEPVITWASAAGPCTTDSSGVLPPTARSCSSGFEGAGDPYPQPLLQPQCSPDRPTPRQRRAEAADMCIVGARCYRRNRLCCNGLADRSG